MGKIQYKNIIELSNEFEIDKKINELRSKLNTALESNIDMHEIISISQELDKYIVFKQHKLIEKINNR